MMARPTCACGECQKCKHREYMRDWYRRPGTAERARGWARRYRAANYDKVLEYDRARGRRGDPEKDRARRAVKSALHHGTLVRQACEGCGLGAHARHANGRLRVHAHHDDYTKPLDVRWLCSACHGAEHRRVA